MCCIDMCSSTFTLCLCSSFTLVVDLFNKDNAEDGGLRFFLILQKHRAQINYLDTRLSPSLRLSLAERERTHLTPSAANLILIC